MLQIALLISICIFSGAHAANLETVHDEELLNLIKTEKYVVVLFSKFVLLPFYYLMLLWGNAKILLAIKSRKDR